MFAKKWPLRIASGVMFLLALVPGLPKFPFFLLAAVVAWLASQRKAFPGQPYGGELRQN